MAYAGSKVKNICTVSKNYTSLLFLEDIAKLCSFYEIMTWLGLNIFYMRVLQCMLH